MFERTFRNLDNDLRQEAACTTELDYTEQTSWLLFLKYLDDLEREREMEASLKGKSYDYLIDDAHRWSTWAVPQVRPISRSGVDVARRLPGRTYSA